MDKAFLGLAELLLEISLGLHPREIPRSRPASPAKTLFIPSLLLGLTHSLRKNNVFIALYSSRILMCDICQVLDMLIEYVKHEKVQTTFWAQRF